MRLCDVAPDGASARVTYGILNLAHRESHAHPSPVVPGAPFRVAIQLDDIAYAFPPGHRLRVAISTSYWPLIWPAPEAATLSLETGSSCLILPRRDNKEEPPIEFEASEAAPPILSEELRPASGCRRLEKDLASGEVRLIVSADFGAQRLLSHGLEVGSTCEEIYSIHPDDPLCAKAEIHWTQTRGRGEWQTAVECRGRQWADKEHFYLESEVSARLGGEEIFAKRWERKNPAKLSVIA